MKGEFEIGDRVIYTYNNSHKTGGNESLDGMTGTIVYYVDDDPHSYYHVQFDKSFSHGHSCNGYCTDGYGYSVDPIYLQLENKIIIPTKIRWYKNGKLSAPVEENKLGYDDFITNDDFREFLIKNNAYNDYIKFFNKDNFSLMSPAKYFENAFSWSATGKPLFWAHLNKQWKQHLSKINNNL